MYFDKIIMTLKYGELTIIYDNKVQTLVNTFFSWLNDEKLKKEPTKYIFLFNDGIICDETNIKDFNFEFLNSCLNLMPVYFHREKFVRIYFRKSHKEIKTEKIDFDNLFMSYPKYDSSVHIKSVYNEIYYCHKKLEPIDVFGIIRIPSSDNMPRFQFAYDSSEFTKEEVSYVIHHIFNECIK
jgi:hypothetical protein